MAATALLTKLIETGQRALYRPTPVGVGQIGIGDELAAIRADVDWVSLGAEAELLHDALSKHNEQRRAGNDHRAVAFAQVCGVLLPVVRGNLWALIRAQQQFHFSDDAGAAQGFGRRND